MDVLASDGHIDVHYTVGSGSASVLNSNNSVNRLGWDTFEHPFHLDPLLYSFTVDNVVIWNKMLAVANVKGIYLRRAGD